MKRLLPILFLFALLLTGCSNMSASAIQSLQQESYQDGYADGHEEGYDEGYDAGYKKGLEDGSPMDDDPPPDDPPPDDTPPDNTDINYVVNTHTNKFHLPSCSSVNDIKPKNRKDWTGTRQELIDSGYVPCKRCNP